MDTSNADQIALLSSLPKPSNQPAPHKVTIMKAFQGTKYHFAKNHITHTMCLPVYMQYSVQTANNFEELYSLYEKLLPLHRCTQILGEPNEHTLALHKASPNTIPTVERKLKFFDFYPTDGKNVLRTYIPLDLDKVPPELHTTEFTQALEEHDLTPDIIHDQTNLLLKELFPTSTTPPPAIVRLSGSFGLQNKPGFRAHVFIELDQQIAHNDLVLYLSQFEWLDFTTLRNATQPLYTSQPITASPDLDPLSTSLHDIPRLYLFNKNNPPVPTSSLYNYFKATPIQQMVPGKSRKGNWIKAIDLPDVVGMFNRAAQNDTEISLGAALRRLGYEWRNTNRWLSPTSTTGAPGCMMFTEGYVMDFHDDSPITDFTSSYKQRLFSAYDLWKIIHINENTTPAFNRLIETLAQNDTIYQSYWQKEIEVRTTYIVDGMSVEQIEEIVDGLVQDIFYHRMSWARRKKIFEDIAAKVKSLNIKGVSFPRTELDKKYQALRDKLRGEHVVVFSKNKDAMNTEALLNEIKIVPARNNQGFFVQSYDSTFLELLTDQELSTRLFRYISDLATDPQEWQLKQVQNVTGYTIAHLKSLNPDTQSLHVSHNKYILRRTSTDDVRECIDVTDNSVQPVTLDQGILNRLPFTKQEYDSVLTEYENKSFEETYWGQFLLSSLGREDVIAHLRDMITYLFMPERKAQVVLAFIGVSRSGKSTIKNILLKLLGRNNCLERIPRQMAKDMTALHDLTDLTRLLVINEFNAREISKSMGMGEIVNVLKSLSGRDSAPVRRMRENTLSIVSDAAPLIISNEMPAIKDGAFQARMRIIEFENGFPNNEETEFLDNLEYELPYIFDWIVTNPSIKYKKNGTPFVSLQTPKGKLQQVRDTIESDMDPFSSFLKKYLVPDVDGWVSNKDRLFFYDCYFMMLKGYRLDMEALNSPKYGIQVVKQDVKGNLKTGRGSKNRLNIAGEYSREWGVSGMRWKDPERMIAELTTFSRDDE